MEAYGRSTTGVLSVPSNVSSFRLDANNPNISHISAGDASVAGYTTSPTDTIYGATPTYSIPSNDPRYPATQPTPIAVPYGTVAASGNPALGTTTSDVTTGNPHWPTSAPAWGGDNSRVPGLPAATNPNPEPNPSILPIVGIGLVLLAAWCL